MSRRTDVDHLRDIAEAAEKAQQFTDGMSFEDFVRDEKTVFAVIRALEVVGEATKRIPDALRHEHDHVPWKLMAGMRDKLIHDYVNVSLPIVWKTVREEIPAVLTHLESIIDQLD